MDKNVALRLVFTVKKSPSVNKKNSVEGDFLKYF
jgi:hypothetical protein